MCGRHMYKSSYMQTFVRNHYSAHLREILLTLQNEYTDWADEGGEDPEKVKEQVRNKVGQRLRDHAL